MVCLFYVLYNLIECWMMKHQLVHVCILVCTDLKSLVSFDGNTLQSFKTLEN